MTPRLSDTQVLETDRLTLRAATMQDWPAFRDFYASDAAAFVGGPADQKTAWRQFATQTGHWTLKGFGWFTLADATGVVGVCGLHEPPMHSDMEIGWMTYAAAQGKGYATEAARAVLTWGWPRFPDTPRIVSYIDEGNAASQAVATKLGATWDGDMAPHDPLCQVWVHRRPAA